MNVGIMININYQLETDNTVSSEIHSAPKLLFSLIYNAMNVAGYELKNRTFVKTTEYAEAVEEVRIVLWDLRKYIPELNKYIRSIYIHQYEDPEDITPSILVSA